MHAYTTATGDQRPGWDAFDHLVAQAAAKHAAATVDAIAESLPAGISYHLIEQALHHGSADDTNVRYLTTNHQHALTLLQIPSRTAA